MTSIMIKSKALLTLRDEDAASESIASLGRRTFDNDGIRLVRVDMDVTRWEDLGSPDVITVTIEPGDLLNSKN